jgi:hypothetical protein
MTCSCVATNVPSNFRSNDIHVICPKNKPFFAETLNAGNLGGDFRYWS